MGDDLSAMVDQNLDIVVGKGSGSLLKCQCSGWIPHWTSGTFQDVPDVRLKVMLDSRFVQNDIK